MSKCKHTNGHLELREAQYLSLLSDTSPPGPKRPATCLSLPLLLFQYPGLFVELPILYSGSLHKDFQTNHEQVVMSPMDAYVLPEGPCTTSLLVNTPGQ